MASTPPTGSSIRQARIARVRLIRRRVVAGTLALFVAIWLLIAVTLVSGHDPALARQSADRTSGSASTSSPAASAGSSASTGSDSSGVSASSPSGPGAVTTRQS